MPHDSHHHLPDAALGDRRVLLAIGANVGLTVVQVVGGLLAGSIAVIADAVHNLSDAVSLGIALIARKIARRPANAHMTHGHGRIELVAALINLVTLIVMGLWLAGEGIARLSEPGQVGGWLMIIISLIALAVDGLTAALTFSMARDSANIRAAFLHNLADALATIAVLVAGLLIAIWGWVWLDPLLTLAIAGYIIWLAIGEIGGVIRGLMLGAPDGLDADTIVATLCQLDGIEDVHNVRLWSATEKAPAFEAHLAISAHDWAEAMAIRDQARLLLSEGFGIGLATLELEPAGSCPQASVFGYTLPTDAPTPPDQP